jgi:AcrR family transcriptional regulator
VRAGFAGASAREIARRADCNQALVFYHFGSVTELLLAGLDDVSTRRLAA